MPTQRELEAQNEAKAQAERAAAAFARLSGEPASKAQQQATFDQSPAGRARAAFERGDEIFQFELDVRNSVTYTIPMWKTGAITTTTDAGEVLNSIVREGWSLINGSFVFHETGSESRDKFMATGQHIAVKGVVVGYYLFSRDASKQAAPKP